MTAGVGRGREGVVRAALSDLYFHSVPLVALNVLWGLGALAIVFSAITWSLVVVALSPLLAIPAMATFRMAARIVRQDGDRSVGGALGTATSTVVGTILLGSALGVAIVVLASNTIIGLTGTEPFEWVLGTLAAWGLVTVWAGGLAALPLLVDPLRADRSIGDRLRLAAAVLLANPRRFATLGLSTAVFVVVSAVLTVVLLSTSLAIIALIACRVVYPLADRLEPTTSASR